MPSSLAAWVPCRVGLFVDELVLSERGRGHFFSISLRWPGWAHVAANIKISDRLKRSQDHTHYGNFDWFVNIMVYYFTSSTVSPAGFIYVGKDKVESENNASRSSN